jgi:hypothetical protein
MDAVGRLLAVAAILAIAIAALLTGGVAWMCLPSWALVLQSMFVIVQMREFWQREL